ncbi:nucleic acid-binding, OB-fold protein [Artemisia annua]|uniref:Nucleic acid-binding, OB-fold protein n=1 Tax=Artemisia annua TaxID=35608 RepID=A0A2U1N9W8_ARTAN|nr:nucleic acid-binding, OB-fold protein [Artemisia annua]
MTETSIKELQPTSRNKIIEAKVYRAWMARDPPEKGTAIQANTDANEKNHFTNILITGKAYRISGFTCAPTENWQQTPENRTSLLLTRFTKFDPIPPTGFPHHYFDFVSYNQLPYRVIDPLDKTRKHYSDELAETFKKAEIDALEKPVIIAVSSCRVTRFRNNLQLSSTPATYYYINPMILELEQYKAEYRAAFNLNPPLQIGVRFTSEATITGINTSREWYYPSCTSCTVKAHINEGMFECRVHESLVSPTYRYNFKAYVTDSTETVMTMFFSPKANDIVGIDCDSLVNLLENPNPREIPDKILATIGKTHIFQFHYNTNSKQAPVQEQQDTYLKTLNTPQHEQVSAAIHSIPTATPITMIEATQAAATQAHAKGKQTFAIYKTNDKLLDIIYHHNQCSITIKETASPPTTYSGIQTRSKTDMMSTRPDHVSPKTTTESSKRRNHSR